MARDLHGFKVFFEKDCELDDQKFFLWKYPNVDKVINERVHCTSCDCHIGTAPHSAKQSTEFDKGDDGSDSCCKWCGDGGILFCCTSCPSVFCKKCIEINCTVADLENIEKVDKWSCFSCNKQSLNQHRARHWALQNYIKKQEENIMKNIPLSHLKKL